MNPAKQYAVYPEPNAVILYIRNNFNCINNNKK